MPIRVVGVVTLAASLSATSGLHEQTPARPGNGQGD
jgi:hypothetical protein